MNTAKKTRQQEMPQMVVNRTPSNDKQINHSYLLDPGLNTVNENPHPSRNFAASFWPMADKQEKKELSVNSIFIKANDQIINLKLSDILWVEAYGDYVNFFTRETRYLVHATMKAVESKLPTVQFARVHRSFIIRFDKIDLIEESIIQINKKLIPIGESYRSEFFSQLNFL
jgi:DNA-binding LytR/AlgR family response regulator